jgi:hypothetical protein
MPRQSGSSHKRVLGKSLERISVFDLVEAVRLLPEDEPVFHPRVWYRTQKEHWIGWASGYPSSGGGAYSRKPGQRRAAALYGRIRNLDMLRWLAEAAGVSGRLLARAREAAASAASRGGPAQAAAFRAVVTWPAVLEALREQKIEIPRRGPFWTISLELRFCAGGNGKAGIGHERKA